MDKQQTPVKEQIIRVRVTQRFKKAIEKKAIELEKNVSEYIRYVLEKDLLK